MRSPRGWGKQGCPGGSAPSEHGLARPGDPRRRGAHGPRARHPVASRGSTPRKGTCAQGGRRDSRSLNPRSDRAAAPGRAFCDRLARSPVPRSSRGRPANDRETMGNDGLRRVGKPAGQGPNSAIAAARGIGARLLWEQEVGGSNPPAPTRKSLLLERLLARSSSALRLRP